MKGNYLRDRFDFHNYRVRYDQIETIPALHVHVSILQRKVDLALEGNGSVTELSRETCLIGRFQQARAEPTVNFYSRSQNIVSEVV